MSPRGPAQYREGAAFIAAEISPNTYVNVMGQYHPCYRADDLPPLDQPITVDEFRRPREVAKRHGLTRLDAGW